MFKQSKCIKITMSDNVVTAMSASTQNLGEMLNSLGVPVGASRNNEPEANATNQGILELGFLPGLMPLGNNGQSKDTGLSMNACRDNGTLKIFENNSGHITIRALNITLNVTSASPKTQEPTETEGEAQVEIEVDENA